MGRDSPFDKLRDREGDAGAEHVEAQTRYSLLGQAKRAELERDRLRDRDGGDRLRDRLGDRLSKVYLQDLCREMIADKLS